MSRIVRGVAAVVVLAWPLAAWGHGFPFRARGTVSYYYPAAVSYGTAVAYDPYPVYVAPPPIVCPPPQYPLWSPDAAPRTTEPPLLKPNYAAPTAAPPSAEPSREAPAPRQPRVSESPSYYDVYAVAPRDTAEASSERCSASFWNLTDRDLTITVEGQSRVVPRGKSLPLAVGRKFVWQVQGREAQTQQVTTGESSLEIVIRR